MKGLKPSANGTRRKYRYKHPLRTANRGICGGSAFQPCCPRRATTALPGTLAKLLIMQARAKRGESLVHPDDAKHFPTHTWKVPIVRAHFRLDLIIDDVEPIGGVHFTSGCDH
jgi:hypothetical protein